jgi:hypothetical protein
VSVVSARGQCAFAGRVAEWSPWIDAHHEGHLRRSFIVGRDRNLSSTLDSVGDIHVDDQLALLHRDPSVSSPTIE